MISRRCAWASGTALPVKRKVGAAKRKALVAAQSQITHEWIATFSAAYIATGSFAGGIEALHPVIMEPMMARLSSKIIGLLRSAQANLDAQGSQGGAATLPDEEWLFKWGTSALGSERSLEPLWAKILAGEFETKGTFSRRTLQILSILSQAEAKDFERLCSGLWGEDRDLLISLLSHKLRFV